MNTSLTRADFLRGLGATSGLALAGCASFGTAANYRVPEGKMVWANLLHLGLNMWDDYLFDPEEANVPGSRYHGYVRTQKDLWLKAVDESAAKGCNMLIIDLGEALQYPSHPELAVKGSWTVEEMREELARIRSLGMEPIPKLNFSSCHDAWLKYYHRMLGTQKYYEVVADLIKDVSEIFDHPRYFHIGYDEELAVVQKTSFFVAVRQGDLWWHDLNYTLDQVVKNGARPMMWSDKMWTSKREFLEKMSHVPLQMPWYYRRDFTQQRHKWDYNIEKDDSWGGLSHTVLQFKVLSENGFEMMPSGSNFYDVESIGHLLDYCKKNLNPELVKGYCMTAWRGCVPDPTGKTGMPRILEALDVFKAAHDKYYPGA